MNANVTYSDIETKMGASTSKIKVQDLSGADRDTTIVLSAKPEDVKQLMVYEEWYFDKKLSTFEVRIIGICPIFMGLNPGNRPSAKSPVVLYQIPRNQGYSGKIRSLQS